MVEIRLVTTEEGERKINRMRDSFHHIPQTAFVDLASKMINYGARFSQNDLRGSEAYAYFVNNVGRGQRFGFAESSMKSCSKFPGQVLIVLDIEQRVQAENPRSNL